MSARFWIATLACAAIVSSSGCGSCRWSQPHGWLPSACVSPRCKNPGCLVCSPVPPLYDGWGYAGEMVYGPHEGEIISHDGMCMPGGECGSCGDGVIMEHDAHMMQSMPIEGLPEGAFEGMSDRERNATIFQQSPEMSVPPMEPTPAAPPSSLSPTPTDVPPSSIPQTPMPRSTIPSAPPMGPMEPMAPMDPMHPTNAPAPPVASPTAGVRPSDFFGPRSQKLGSAPAPVEEPVQLAAPPQWETQIQIEPVWQSSLKAPSRQ